MGSSGLSADPGAAAEKGDHRLGRRHLACDRAEALVIIDRFDVEQRRADLRPLAQPGEIVLYAEMDGIADRHDGCQRQVARVGLVDHLFGERPRLRDEGEAVLPGSGWKIAHEGGGEAPFGIEVDDARAIRPGDGEIAFGGELQQRLVARNADGSGFGEAAGQDQQVRDAAVSALFHRIQDRVGADHDHRELDWRIDRSDRGHRPVTEDGAAFGIDRYDSSAISRLAQHLHDGAAGRGGALAGADDGDAARGEERVEVANAHGHLFAAQTMRENK